MLCSVSLTVMVVVMEQYHLEILLEELESSTFLMALRCQYQAMTLPGPITETESLGQLDLIDDQMVQ